MKIQRFRFLTSLLVIAFVAGCGLFGTPPPPPTPPPPVAKRDLVKEIRAAAAKAGDLLVIEPIANPAVAALLQKVETAESKGDYAAADKLSQQAEQIDGSNPVVAQLRAEQFLRKGSFSLAESLAKKSYQASAQLGPLCVRNWLTIAEVCALRKDALGEQQARQKAIDCPVKAQQRL
jgi:hypothetical protein